MRIRETTDGVLIKEGLMVYYVDNTLMNEVIKAHPVQNTPIGLSIDNIRAVGNKIFSEEHMANNFRNYVRNKRMKTFCFTHKPEEYSPTKEI